MKKMLVLVVVCAVVAVAFALAPTVLTGDRGQNSVAVAVDPCDDRPDVDEFAWCIAHSTDYRPPGRYCCQFCCDGSYCCQFCCAGFGWEGCCAGTT